MSISLIHSISAQFTGLIVIKSLQMDNKKFIKVAILPFKCYNTYKSFLYIKG